MSAPREPKPLAGAVYRPGAGYHSYPPPKDRTPRPRACSHCQLVATTNERTCPVCGARYNAPLGRRLLRHFART